jgi:hypothetical protein
VNSRWVRALPLLLSSSVLFIAGAFMFFRAADNVASIASMTAGVLAFGAWMATACIDWFEGKPQQPPAIEESEEDAGA